MEILHKFELELLQMIAAKLIFRKQVFAKILTLKIQMALVVVSHAFCVSVRRSHVESITSFQ